MTPGPAEDILTQSTAIYLSFSFDYTKTVEAKCGEGGVPEETGFIWINFQSTSVCVPDLYKLVFSAMKHETLLEIAIILFYKHATK